LQRGGLQQFRAEHWWQCRIIFFFFASEVRDARRRQTLHG
jgi:hypothetical protein